MKEFNIKVKMPERWVPHFCSFLKELETNGVVGHSAVVGIFSDGDGDFNPKFEIGTEYEPVKGYEQKEKIRVEKVYDAD